MAVKSNIDGDASAEILADDFSAELAKLEPRICRQTLVWFGRRWV